jgi:hypothetical protein
MRGHVGHELSIVETFQHLTKRRHLRDFGEIDDTGGGVHVEGSFAFELGRRDRRMKSETKLPVTPLLAFPVGTRATPVGPWDPAVILRSRLWALGGISISGHNHPEIPRGPIPMTRVPTGKSRAEPTEAYQVILSHFSFSGHSSRVQVTRPRVPMPPLPYSSTRKTMQRKIQEIEQMIPGLRSFQMVKASRGPASINGRPSWKEDIIISIDSHTGEVLVNGQKVPTNPDSRYTHVVITPRTNKCASLLPGLQEEIEKNWEDMKKVKEHLQENPFDVFLGAEDHRVAEAQTNAAELIADYFRMCQDGTPAIEWIEELTEAEQREQRTKALRYQGLISCSGPEFIEALNSMYRRLREVDPRPESCLINDDIVDRVVDLLVSCMDNKILPWTDSEGPVSHFTRALVCFAARTHIPGCEYDVNKFNAREHVVAMLGKYEIDTEGNGLVRKQ